MVVLWSLKKGAKRMKIYIPVVTIIFVITAIWAALAKDFYAAIVLSLLCIAASIHERKSE
jgi:uncharacterized MnhB-related membrane protein